VLRCTDCQGQFTYPPPSPELLGQFYKDSFSYKWYQNHYPAKLLDALHRVLQYRRLGAIGEGPLLDYGGGVGYFGRAARLLGYKAETRDPMYESVTEQKSADAAPAQTYATVTCHHVLEHAIDPAAMLRSIHALLQPGGKLIIAVPNAASLGYLRRGVHWVWSQPPLIHLHHLTPAGLQALLGRTGFAVEKELFFDRWDASVAADVKWAQRFARWDARWSSTPWKWGTAQLNSARRFVALAASYVTSTQAPSDRAELLIVARAETPRSHPA
jgi:SAM-dependent methyltransferase